MNPAPTRFVRLALPAVVALFSLGGATANADVYLINTDTMTVTRDGAIWDFGGQLSSAGIINGKATFYLGGNLELGAGDVLRGIGSRPVSFNVGNDMIVSPFATIDFSAAGTTAGAGGGDGGAGGSGGFGGTGGEGGAGGGVQWVRGGGAFMFFFGAAPPPVPGLDGHYGEDGTAGRAGGEGYAGHEGERGFNNIAPLAAGGSPVYDDTTYFNSGYGGNGGLAAKYWPDVVPTFLGGDSKDGGPGFNGITGSIGGTGATGGNGYGGQFLASPSNTFELVAGNGGGGGAGGQGGDGGGGGGGGGGGAAGQGNWATVIVPPLPPSFIPGWNFAGFGGSGGPGSDGGDGGFGGSGGSGGDGGAGAGAVEFLVQGNITFNGTANANGGNGETGNSGSIGLPGYSPGEYNEAGNIAAIIPIPGVQTFPGGIIATSPFLGGIGGIGGVGAYGGEGGQGGTGGGGGGGSGGTIKLVGTSVIGTGNVSLHGGLGGDSGSTEDDGEAGRFLVGSNTVAEGSSAIGALGGATLDGNDTTTQAGTRVVNPMIADESSVPTIAGLIGGGEAFGFTGLNANDIYIGADSLIDLTPQEAFAGVARLDLGPGSYGDDYIGYDMLLLFEAKGTQLSNPMLGIGEEDYLVPMLNGGWSKDLLFGGSGDTAVTTMNGFDVYATLIPEDAEWFNFSVDSGGVILSAKQQILNDGELFFVTSSPDVPVLDSTWIGASGNWSNAANWSMVFNETGLAPTGLEDPAVPGVPSNSAAYAYNIHIDQDVTVNTDITIAVDQLNIGAGDTVSIQGGQALTIERFAVRTDSGKINNDGVIMLDGSVGSTARMYISGPGLMLDGTGTLTTTNDQANNIIAGLRKGDSLTQFADHTIDASGLLGNDKLVMTNHGSIFTNGGLTIDPVGGYDRSSAAFTNTGLVQVDGEGNYNSRRITLSDGFFVNESGGTMEAVDGGRLELDAARLHNDGTIRIDPTSSLLITDAVLTGNDIVFEEDVNGLAELHVSGGQLINGTHLLAPFMSIGGSDVMNIDGGKIGGLYAGSYASYTDIGNSTITGGELDGELYASTSTFKDVTLLSGAYFDGSNIGFAGRIDNQTSTDPLNPFGYFYTYDAQIVEDATFAGEGEYEVEFLYGSGNDAAPNTLTIAAESTLRLNSEARDGLIINNQGTLDVITDVYMDPAGNQSSSFAGLRNSGTISNSSGFLYIYDGIIDNTGGVIDSTYSEFDGVTLIGGTYNGYILFTGSSTSYIVGTTFQDSQNSSSYIETESDIVLEDVTLTQPTEIYGWNSTDPSAVVLKNKLNMDGIGSLKVDSITLAFDNDFTFDGQGSLLASATSLISNSAGPIKLTIGEQFTIDGTGNANFEGNNWGADSIEFVNRGTIDGNASVISLDPVGDMNSASPGIVNRGVIKGTEVYIEDANIDNRDGVIGEEFGTVYLSGVNIVGGELRNFSFDEGGLGFNNYLPESRLENVRLEGYGETYNDLDLTLAGTIENNADVVFGGTINNIIISGSVQFTGTGTMTFESDTSFSSLSEDDTLVNEAGHTLDFSNAYNSFELIQGSLNFTNNGTIIVGEASLSASFSTELLPAGAQVPDLSDPENPDAVMTLTEDTEYLVPRTLNNNGNLQGFLLDINDTAIRNSGTISVDELYLNRSSLINDGGSIESLSIYIDGSSTISGGAMLYPYIEVTDYNLTGPAGIASIDMGEAYITAHAEVEFGGIVSNIDLLELYNDAGDVRTVTIENADTVVTVNEISVGTGRVQLSAGVLRTNTFYNGTSASVLDWTGGTFGVLEQTVELGSTKTFGTQMDITTGKTLEAPMGIAIDAGATLNIGAGDLQTPSIVNNGQVNVGLEDANGTFDQPITGTGALAKQGGGTVYLTGANTYAGGTTIQGGTLEVDTSENLGDAAGSITFAGGNLRVLGADTGATSRVISLNNSTTIDIVDPDAVFEVSSATNNLPTSSSFTKSGEGTLNYHAPLYISRGTLRNNDGELNFFNNQVNLNGSNGSNGGTGQPGTSGNNAGYVYVNGGLLTGAIISANGGNGGNGSDGYFPNLTGRYGGNGADGGVLVIGGGQMQVTSILNLRGGDGGDGGDGDSAVFSYGSGGNGGAAGDGGNIYIQGGELIFTSGFINLSAGVPGDGGYGPGSAPNGSDGSSGSNGTLRLQGGTLTTTQPTLDNALTGNFSFSTGTIRFQDADFDLASSSRLNAVLGSTTKTFSNGRSLHVDNVLNISASQTLNLAAGSSLTAGTIDHTLGGTFNFYDGTLSFGTFQGDLAQLGGIVAPGNSPGSMQITGDYVITSGTIEVELMGLVQGAEYDFIDVLGDLILGDASLDVTVLDAFTLQTNQQFDILSITGTRTGAFTGLAEGAIVTSFGNYDLAITYLAGDGNDIALTVQPTIGGDLNGDGFVGLNDLDIVLAAWNEGVPPGDPIADANNDGYIGLDDLDIILANWNAGTPPINDANIPEPITLATMLLGSLAMLRRSKRAAHSV